ncbi:hypothetical protein PRK78_004652 [Emydomyces testavorans]|uniref:Uncharacterized protein n=1 Tax=Emydomyces testavorans TaxID=2070801 RepID=A0AAF0DJ66_9EURO|nr:hypothetical protein PRK78_004652 [Emydomyces testavorans]
MASRYDMANYDSDEEREKYPQIPKKNLTSAVLFCVKLFNSKQISYTVTGGYAVKLLGGERDTRNVDMYVGAKMKDIWKLLESESCVILPQTKLLGDMLRIFVRTGPGWADSNACELEIPIAVNLVETITQGPSSVAIQSRRQSRVQAGLGRELVYTTGIFFLIKNKIAAFASYGREEDRTDLIFLMHKYPEKVIVKMEELDMEASKVFLDSIPPEDRAKLVEEIFEFTIDGCKPP